MVPGHVNCSTKSVPLDAPQALNPASSPCHWEEIQHQNGLACAVVKPAGVGWLDAFELSILWADLRHTQEHGCLHYCLPGPPDDWNRLWLLLYHHQQRGVSLALGSGGSGDDIKPLCK